MNKQQQEYLLANAKTTAIMGCLRGYYNELIAVQKQINKTNYKKELLFLENYKKDKEVIKQLRKTYRYKNNCLNKHIKEFDKFISKPIDNQEDNSQTLYDFTDIMIEHLDNYIEKAIIFKDDKIAVNTKKPLFKLSIEEYSAQFNTPIHLIQNVCTDSNNNKFVLI